MHKKSLEISKKSPGSPDSTHSDSISEEVKGKDSDISWSNRASTTDDMEDMAIDLSSTSKQENKSTLKTSPLINGTNSDSDNES